MNKENNIFKAVQEAFPNCTEETNFTIAEWYAGLDYDSIGECVAFIEEDITNGLEDAIMEHANEYDEFMDIITDLADNDYINPEWVELAASGELFDDYDEAPKDDENDEEEE